MLARRWSTDGELGFWTQIYIHNNTGCMTNGSQGVSEVEIKICVCVSERKKCTKEAPDKNLIFDDGEIRVHYKLHFGVSGQIGRENCTLA